MRTLIAMGAVAILASACQMTEAPPPSLQPSRPLPEHLSEPHTLDPPMAEPTAPATPTVPTLPPSTDCGASQLQQHVGGPIPDPFPAGDNPMRIYRAGDPVTADHNANRLNIELDGSGSRIVAITCG